MQEYVSWALAVATLLTGCSSAPVSRQANDHYYRTVSFPATTLKSDPLERIEAVKVVMQCGRFVAINHIPDDWSAQIVSPVSEETTLLMEAGHGSSSLCRSSDLDGFISVLVCEPACFKITATLSVFSFDMSLHERKITFKQRELLMVPMKDRLESSLHQRGSGGGEFFELVGADFGIVEVK